MNTRLSAYPATPQGTVRFFKPGLLQTGKKAAGLILMAGLAACSSVVPRGGDAPNASNIDEKIVVPADGKHHIALLLPITGPDAEIGKSLANAAYLAMDDTKNTTVTLTTYDTGGGVQLAAQRAIAEGNKLILGPLRGDEVIAVSNIASPRRVPIISFSNDVGAAGRNVYLLGHLPNQAVDRIVRYARSKGSVRFGAIVPSTIYGQRALSNYTRAVRDAGGTLVSIQEYGSTAASVEEAAKKLQASGKIDAVLIGDTGATAIATAPYLRKHGMKDTRILGTELWNINGSIASNKSLRNAWFASVPDTYFSTYAGKYKTRFGTLPPRISTLGYDSILLVTKVVPNWRLGATFPITNLIDRGGFIGLDGAFRFNADGSSERMLEVQEVQAGKFTVIDAAPKVFAP
jgi:branched-chain amino acid transport system substrate-binding protein